MPKIVKVTPTAHLRIVEIDSRKDEEVPRFILPGWPECGPTYFKLQQKWLGSDGSVSWQDIEIQYSPDQEPVDHER